MSVQRSPPDSLHTPNTNLQYNSDSALNTSCMQQSADNYFNITKRQKRSFAELPVTSSASNSDIKSMFVELKEQQDMKFESLNNVLTTIMSQNQDIQKSVETISGQHQDLLFKIHELEQENKEYKDRVASLELKLEQLEKSAHCTTLEVRNLHKQPNENKETLTNIISNIGSTLGLDSPIQNSEIREIFRTRSDAVLVEFTTSFRKESFMSNFINYNKNRRQNKESQLNTEHINLIGPKRPIYISEFLSSKMRRIFYVARENVKHKKLFAAWTSYGKIYIKKELSSKPIRIVNEIDLCQQIA
ncbi:unnamed protein product [Colias eurytheme]|nr:unnamed protein product [Colias eurytheme]